MSRRDIRETAFKLFYNYSITGNLLIPELAEEDDIFGIKRLTSEEYIFLERILSDFKKHESEIDNAISKNLRGWKFERISKVDLSILRLAISEIKYEDTPPKVVINEAVDIAKEYSGDKSHKFINGILATLLAEILNKETENKISV